MALRAGGGLAVAAGSEVKKNVAPTWKARLTRNRLGLDMEPHLPGGVRSVQKRDKLGRALSHEIWSTTKQVSAKSSWRRDWN